MRTSTVPGSDTTLDRIPSGTLVYRVHAKTAASERPVYVGSITTESLFVASDFGDRVLALQHAWGSPDTNSP